MLDKKGMADYMGIDCKKREMDKWHYVAYYSDGAILDFQNPKHIERVNSNIMQSMKNLKYTCKNPTVK